MSASSRAGILPKLIPLLFILFVLFAVSRLWTAFVEINNSTRAVSPSESPHIAFLNRWYPYVSGAWGAAGAISAAIGGVGAFLSLRLKGGGKFKWFSFALFAVYVAAVAAASADVRGVALAGTALVVLYAAYEASGAPDASAMVHFREFHKSVRETGAGALAGFLFKILLLFIIAGALLLFVEAVAFTVRYSGVSFGEKDFITYLAYSASAGALVCGVLSLAALVPVVVTFILSRVRRSSQDGAFFHIFALIPPVEFGVLAGTVFLYFSYAFFGAEIEDLKLGEPIFVMAFLIVFFVTMAGYVNFKFILKRLPAPARPRVGGDYAVALAMGLLGAVLLPFTLAASALPKRYRINGGWLLFAALVSAGLMMWAFGDMNYPMLHEYSYKAQGLYSILMTGIAIASLFVIVRFAGFRASPRLRYALPVALILPAAALFAYLRLDQSNVMRMMINEYAPLGRSMEAMLHGAAGENLGLDGKPEGEFALRGRRHDFLPDVAETRGFKDAPPPIIYVVLDGVRPDRMSLNGYDRKTTPEIEKFAREAVVFKNARSVSTATTCAMRGVFSGSYSTRSITDNSTVRPFFTDELLEAGYAKFFITYFPHDRNGVGLDSFTRTVAPPERRRFELIRPYDEKAKIAETLSKIDAFEKESAGEPAGARGWFIYLHVNVTHFPWKHCSGPAFYEGAEPFGERPEDLYDECLRCADISLGHFLDGLKERGIYERAVIIVAADHGNGLDDHAKYGGFLPYEEQLRVPFLIKIPGVKPRRIDAPFTTLDIAPTIVSIFKPDAPNRFDGISFLPLIIGAEEAVDREYIFATSAFNDEFAVIERDRWKIIYHRDRGYCALYDLAEDPREAHNLADAMPEKRREMMKILERFLWEGRETYASPRFYG